MADLADDYPNTRRRALLRHLGMEPWPNGRAAAAALELRVIEQLPCGKRSRSSSLALPIELRRSIGKLGRQVHLCSVENGSIVHAALPEEPQTVFIWVSVYDRTQLQLSCSECYDNVWRLVRGMKQVLVNGERWPVKIILHFHGQNELGIHINLVTPDVFMHECDSIIMLCLGTDEKGKAKSLLNAHTFMQGRKVLFLDQDVMQSYIGRPIKGCWATETMCFRDLFQSLLGAAHKGNKGLAAGVHWSDEVGAFKNEQNNPVSRPTFCRREAAQIPLFFIGHCVYCASLPDCDMSWRLQWGRKEEDLLLGLMYHLACGGSV